MRYNWSISLMGWLMLILILLTAFPMEEVGESPRDKSVDMRDYPIGFISHYPLITYNDEGISQTGANVCIVRAPWPLIEKEEGKWDFSLLDQQLEWADKTDIKLIVLLEAGPAHAAGVRWLVEKLKAQGETMCSPKGDIIDDPCYQSQTYRFYLSRFIRQTISYLIQHKHANRIYGYNNGCEWWHPLIYSYSKLDKEGFREWLKQKYGSLQELNYQWGTKWENWEAIEPPVLYPVGVGHWSQGVFLPESAICDLAWCTNEEGHLSVKPGEKLSFHLELETENLTAGAALLEVAWLTADDPRPFKIEWGPPFREFKGNGAINFSLTVPPEANRAWLLLKLHGIGKVTFKSIRVLNEAGENLVLNPNFDPAKGGWQFIAWSAGQNERVSHLWQETGKASITYQPDIHLEGNPQYPLAVVDDWFNYRFESFAKFIDWMASECRSADPSRPVISYLTFSFANPFEWDYMQDVAIALDYFAVNAHNQQIIGMQINSAEGDFDSLTCAIDLVRQFGKPVWAIDLLDFTKGIYLGEAGLTRTSLSVLQHMGSNSGIQYYCWYGTPDYNYAELGGETLKRMISRVKNVAELLRGYEPVCEVALLQPRMPLYPFLPQPPNDWADFMGWYKFLVRAGICPDVYTFHSLKSADLSRYKVLIVPDCAYIPREALETLRKAARLGVKLIGSGRFGLYDMGGRPISKGALPSLTYCFKEPIGKRILGETHRLRDKGNTPPRLICKDIFPNLDLPEIEEVLNTLEKAGVTVLTQPTNATKGVTLIPFKKNERLLVFLLPQSDWQGRIPIMGKLHNVEALGSLIEFKKEKKQSGTR